MENGNIIDSQITASSQYDTRHDPTSARLNLKDSSLKEGAWSARKSDVNQWIQVDFENQTTVTNILTQGRNCNGNYQWVKSYTVYYSNDGIDFKPYQKVGEVKVI